MANEPWLTEGDERDFEAHGLNCAMRRGPCGHWCGYVGIDDKSHPLYGKDYSDVIYGPPKALIERPVDVDKVGIVNLFCAGLRSSEPHKACEVGLLIDVHGGLTFSGNHLPTARTIKIGKRLWYLADGWWFGFDCAHAGDLLPDLSSKCDRLGGNNVYRDTAYVEAECRSLAKQLSEWPE